MKKIVLLILVAGLALGLYAQNVRLAYVNTTRVMMEIADTREAQRLFSIERDNWDKEIDDLTAEIERLTREYETRRLTLSESGKQEAENRIMERMRERQQIIERIYGENGIAERRNNELIAPIMEKLRTVLNQIAIDENYTMIFDASSSGVLWAQERLDITQQVIIEMNRK
jgi:outer membrane protein